MSIRVDTSDIKKKIDDLVSVAKKQIPYVTAVTLNNVAFEAKDELKKDLDRQLDTPTPFTKNGIRVKKANKRNLNATVYFEEKRAKYLKFLINGGIETPDGKAIAVPTTNVKLNKFGNPVKRMRPENLMAHPDAFSGTPRYINNAPAGIWMRSLDENDNGELKLMYIYIDKAKYNKILDMKEPILKVVQDSFADEFFDVLLNVLNKEMK